MVDERTGGAALSQQGFDFPAQIRILSACTCEEAVSPGWLLFQGCMVNLLKSSPALGVHCPPSVSQCYLRYAPLCANAKVQWVKYTACGFRNKQNFIHGIYFHCGGLDLAKGE